MSYLLNQIIKKMTISLVFSIIFVVIGYFIAFPISNYFHVDFKDVMFFEGISITLITLFFSVQGNPSGISLHGLGEINSQYSAYENLETTRIERESTNYFKNFRNHSVVKLTFNTLTIVFGGILITLFSILLA